MERLHLLMAVHNELVRSAGLPEGIRPYGCTNRLEQLEKDIMEELSNNKAAKNDTPPNDDIPY